MPDPAPHDPTSPANSTDKPVPSDVLDWSEQFVKYLQIEFYDVAGETSERESVDQQRRWMMSAFLRTFIDSGMSPQDLDRLYLSQRAAVDRTDEAQWSEAKNERRIELIDKSIQEQLTFEESKELARLTTKLRQTYDNEEFMPMNQAIQLHKRLLDLQAERREQSDL